MWLCHIPFEEIINYLPTKLNLVLDYLLNYIKGLGNSVWKERNKEIKVVFECDLNWKIHPDGEKKEEDKNHWSHIEITLILFIGRIEFTDPSKHPRLVFKLLSL